MVIVARVVLKSHIANHPQRVDLLDDIDEGSRTRSISAIDSGFSEVYDDPVLDFVIECSFVDAEVYDTPQVSPCWEVDGLFRPPQQQTTRESLKSLDGFFYFTCLDQMCDIGVESRGIVVWVYLKELQKCYEISKAILDRSSGNCPPRVSKEGADRLGHLGPAIANKMCCIDRSV
jgi:hypothetical protein